MSEPTTTPGIVAATPASPLVLGLRPRLAVALFAVTYALAHAVAFLFPDSDQVLMAVWPAGGIGLAAFLLMPQRLWLGLVLCFYAAGVSADILLANRPFLASIGYMTGNMVESLGCAWLIHRWGGRSPRFDRVREVLALIAGVVLVNAVGACIGALTAATSTDVTFVHAWPSWYISHGLGILLVTPLIIAWGRIGDSIPMARPRSRIESGAFLVLWSWATWLAIQPASHIEPFTPHPYMLLALLAWPALRLGQQVVSLSLVLLWALSIARMVTHPGPAPLGGQDLPSQLLMLQVFLGTAGAFSLLFAANRGEQRAAESSLHESRGLLQAILDNSPSLVYLKDLDGRFLLVNRPFTRLFGSSVEDLMGKSSYEVVRPDLAEAHLANDRQVLATGHSLATEEQNVEADGLHTYLSVKFPLKDADGRTTAVCGISTDITQRKQMEDILRLNEERLRMSLEATTDAIWEWDLATGRTYFSPRWYDMLGYKPGELEANSKQWVALTHPDDRDTTLETISQAVADGANYKVEFRTKHADGHWVWCLVRGKVTGRDAADKPIRISGTCSDITDRKRVEEQIQASQAEVRRMLEVSDRSRRALLSLAEDQRIAEAALRDSEERFSKAFRDAPVLIAITDLENATYVDVNEESLRVSGFTRQEVIGHTAAELGWITSEDRTRLVQEIKEHGRILNLEMSFRAKDGRRLHGLVNGEQITIGQRLCLLTVTVDITLRKQAQQRLVEYQVRLRSLASRLALTEERERRSLAERLHDDVSQYLAFCKMKIEMIRKAEQDPSQVAGLTQICDTLGQLLTETRVMTSELYSPVLKVLGFEAAVNSWLQEEIGQKHGLRTEFHDDEQPKPLGDNLKAMVFRCVREILNNVVKHAHANLVRVEVRREQDMLCVMVEDDGQGMVPDEAFSLKVNGFGLFSIRERLAELDGSLELDTAPGRGCRALVRVPLDVQPATSAGGEPQTRCGVSVPGT